MMGRHFLLPVLAGLVLAAGAAHARVPADAGPERREAQTAETAAPLQLAQYRDVEIYIDDRGRQLLVDPYTREVIGVRDPRREYRRPERRVERRGGPYYLDDPEDMERFRRDREALLGRRELPRYEDDYFYDDYGDPIDRDYRYEDDYPEPPVTRREVPVPSPREDVVREPLEAPADDTQVTAVEPDDIEEPDTVPDAVAPAERDLNAVPPMGGNEQLENVARIQILLDRNGLSPGVIDGRMGDNVNKAISAYRDKTGRTLRTYDQDSIRAALEETGGPAFVNYTIQPEDAAGPYIASVPDDYGDKAKLERLGYTSVVEMLAERFHMDEKFLRTLNPTANFGRPGTIIRVANVGEPIDEKVARIVADKGEKQVRAYGADGRLVAAYPATIGSAATPSPTGTHTVERIAFDPEYTYNPKLNFKQGDNDEILKIPPGPNGPVGTIWIALSKPTYGIHGTPEPAKIGKTESNGCVRLTNWDAQELAKVVDEGITVEFIE